MLRPRRAGRMPRWPSGDQARVSSRARAKRDRHRPRCRLDDCPRPVAAGLVGQRPIVDGTGGDSAIQRRAAFAPAPPLCLLLCLIRGHTTPALRTASHCARRVLVIRCATPPPAQGARAGNVAGRAARDGETQQPTIFALAAVLSAVSTAAVALRLFARGVVLRLLGPDDVAIGIAQVGPPRGAVLWLTRLPSRCWRSAQRSSLCWVGRARNSQESLRLTPKAEAPNGLGRHSWTISDAATMTQLKVGARRIPRCSLFPRTQPAHPNRLGSACTPACWCTTRRRLCSSARSWRSTSASSPTRAGSTLAAICCVPHRWRRCGPPCAGTVSPRCPCGT